MILKGLYKKVAEELGITEKEVRLAYKGYWMYIKDSLEQIPFKKGLNEEQFNTYKTNFNISNLGKFYCTYDLYKKRLKRYKYVEDYKNNTSV